VKHILQELEARRDQARLGGGEKRIAAQHAKGKLTARERTGSPSSAWAISASQATGW
jgi:acetyl-CoA carboxylase carboxyltransferase component